MPPRLLMDVDGVIGNFNKLYLDCLLEATGIKKEEKDVTVYNIATALKLTEEQDAAAWQVLNLPGRAFTIEPYPDAVESVVKLSLITDLYFVTAPVGTSRTWVYDRDQWLQLYFGPDLGKKVNYTSQKHICSGDFLVEDKPSTLSEWQYFNPKGTGILWERPYNEESTIEAAVRLSDWESLIMMITEGVVP